MTKLLGRRLLSDRLYIVIPAYNEEMNIRKTVEQWHEVAVRAGEGSRLVVVDDGSRDRTGVVLEECAKRFERLIPLHRENGGHGAAVLCGYRYAVEHGADYIFQTDSDGQTVPDEFWQLWEERAHCGLLIGDRSRRQDGVGRVVVTRVLRFVLRLRFGVFIRDANTPYRLMRAEELAQVIKLLPQNYNLPNVMISVIYQKKGWETRWYPITFRPRQGGKNSINLRRIVKIGWQAWRDFGTFSSAMERRRDE